MLRILVVRIAFIVTFIVCLITLPLMAEDEGFRSVLPWLLFLLFLQLAPTFLASKPDLFNPAVYSGLLAGLGTISTISFFFSKGRIDLSLVRGIDPSQEAELAFTVVIASCVGQISYYASFYHPRWGPVFADLMPKMLARTWDPRRLRISIGVCLAIFVASYAAFQIKLGGTLFDITRLGEGKAVWRDDETMSWMLRGVQIGFIPLFLVLTYVASRSRGQRLPVRSLAALGFVALAIAMLVLRLGQRGMVATALLCTVIIVHYLKRRIPVVVFVGALFLATTVSNLLLPYRATYLRRAGEGPTVVELAQKPTAVIADHEAERQRFSALAVVFHSFPDEHDYLLGRSWLGMIAMPIPRWLWPEKANYFVWRDSQIVWNLAQARVPTSYLGTLYANFSWLGVILGMLLWGAIQSAFYVWLRRHGSEPTVVLLYAVLLTFFGLTMLSMSNVLQYVVPIALIVRFVGRRRTSGLPSEPSAAG